VAYFLGIDGGGTKTTCGVGDESCVLATVTSGPSNIVRVGEATARESLQQVVRQACSAAGIVPEQVARTCVGGSGAARPELAETVRRILAEVLPTPVVVVGDMEIALEAAFGTGPGVVVIAGTGSIAYGRDAQGNTARAGGWGFAIGDEGSAHWIGREAVSAVLRKSDDSFEMENFVRNDLAAALCQVWGVTSLLELARAANAVPPPNFAALFPAVAASKDPIAEEVCRRAGMELGRIAGVVSYRLFPPNSITSPSAINVAMTGGVFRHSAVAKKDFCGELRRFDPRVQINPDVVDPVEGALRIARREM
jgi:N-acetylglucosamine kinase-like BadF-type ATPase